MDALATVPAVRLSPTGKPFTLTGFVQRRINGDGKIAERRATLDLWGLRQQLDVTS